MYPRNFQVAASQCLRSSDSLLFGNFYGANKSCIQSVNVVK